MLEVKNLVAGYGAIEVLKGISLSVKEGEIVTLLGANGAGKTTTLLTLSGVLHPKKGEALFQNEPIQHQPSESILRRGLCLCPEGRRIFPNLTVFENLRIGGVIRSTSLEKEGLERAFEYFPILKERRSQLGGTLSGGEQQMLAIARALMSQPKFLMLDEPSLGLAPVITEKIFTMLQAINKQGTTILLVEQNARQALQIAHRGYVMVTGRIAFEDTSSNLLASDQVRQAYLGEM